VFFPRNCISAGQRYTRVFGIWVTPDRILAHVAEGEDESLPGFAYEFDCLPLGGVKPSPLGEGFS
jgi:hypothetical protein